MKNFNKKQKIILIVICIILLGAILYYVYGKETPSINKNEIYLMKILQMMICQKKKMCKMKK